MILLTNNIDYYLFLCKCITLCYDFRFTLLFYPYFRFCSLTFVSRDFIDLLFEIIYCIYSFLLNLKKDGAKHNSYLQNCLHYSTTLRIIRSKNRTSTIVYIVKFCTIILENHQIFSIYLKCL